MTDNVTTLPPGRTKVIDPRFRLIPFDEIGVTSGGRYLVKGLLPSSGLVVVWGPPKCGKSFWATDLGLHIALGWPYRGRRTRQGAVVYCALEGAEGYGARIEAFRARHLAEDHAAVPFFLVASPMVLVKDHVALLAAIRTTLGDTTPAALVVDTLNRSIGGSESDDRDMAAYIGAADAIRDAFGCVVMVIHHCGTDASRPRGHTSLTGAADAQLAVKRDPAGNVVVTVEWLKDGAEGASIVSKLEQVEVGTDEDGDPITSCLVVPSEGAAASDPARRRLSDRQRLALDALTECAADRGKAPPAAFGLPVGLCAVGACEWRDELFSRGVLDREAKNPRTDFLRIKTGLAAAKLIGERDGLVWRAS